MRFVQILLITFVLVGCADRSFTPTTPSALQVGTSERIFAATNRAKTAEGLYGGDRASSVSLLELTVSVPPSHKPGTLNFGYENPDPKTQFTMAGRREIPSPDAFENNLRRRLLQHPKAEQEVAIFVHGYNATQAETAFRAAQIKHDLAVPGEAIIYSWPSRGRPLSYAYDVDSAMLSRDGLEQLLRMVARTRPNRILLVAHSMGSSLVVETLRQIEIADPGWPAANIQGVVLMSPDLDVDVFSSLMARFDTIPQPFLILSSSADRALRISSRLRGQQPEDRLGSISDTSRINNLPVTLIDTTAFSEEAASSHLVAVTSPTMIAMLRNSRGLARSFEREAKSLPNYLGAPVVRANLANEVTVEPPGEAR
jgi:esterase/lipase superfamily enzyme